MRPLTSKTIGLLAAGLIVLGGCGTANAEQAHKQYETYWWGTTAHALTSSERDLVERIVAAEARGESFECMVGVAQTIRERSEHWGLSIKQTVKYPQYAKPYKGRISDEVKDAVSAVFDDGVRQFSEYTTHFHTDAVDPWWNQSKIQRGVIDNTIFWGVEVK